MRDWINKGNVLDPAQNAEYLAVMVVMGPAALRAGRPGGH